MKDKSWTAFAGGICLVVMLGACSGDAGGGPAAATPVSATPAPPPPLGAIAPPLVGTFMGAILSGPFGPADMWLNLSADAKASFGGGGKYCAANGEWGVTGTVFTARGGDCDGTVVTLVAPASGTSLVGTFTTSRGASGTFTVTKQ